MHGPVDHLHPALAALGADYVVNTVAVRPGFPMLVAQLPGAGRAVRSSPACPATRSPRRRPGFAGRSAARRAARAGRLPALPQVTLGGRSPAAGDYTHLALVRLDGAAGRAHPVPHVGSSMLRGLASSDGFAVIRARRPGRAGDAVPLVPLPLLPGERPAMNAPRHRR